MAEDFIEPIKWENQTLLVLNQLKLPATTQPNPKPTIQQDGGGDRVELRWR